ncbi:MAG: hypothetical protein RL660_383 [Bacteroidota bacterium]|jgi:hypothetical protein
MFKKIRNYTVAFIAITALAQCKEGALLDPDLVPEVDNVTTFFTDTTKLNFQNVAFDSLLTSIKDQQATSTQSFIPFAYATLHALGDINNDPIFGSSHASIAIQFRQQSTSLSFPTSNLILDSLVLQLPYAGFYGDKFKSVATTLNVYRLSTALKNSDSLYNSSTVAYNTSDFLGSHTVDLATLDSVGIENNLKVRALRIKLDTSFARQLLNLDDNAEYKDYSSFVTWFKGLYITANNKTQGTVLGTFAISDATMKLYYRVYNATDTSSQSSTFRYDPNYCSHYNRIERNFTGTPVASAINTVNGDAMYVQADCGAALDLTFPNLKHLQGHLINKAVVVLPIIASGNDLSDTAFRITSQLRVVAYDSSGKQVRIPFANTITGAYIGPSGLVTENGQTYRRYELNLTKTLQRLCTGNPDKIAKLTIRGEGGLRSASGRMVVAGPNRFANNAKMNVIYTKLK